MATHLKNTSLEEIKPLEYRVNVRDMPTEERPRERLLYYGPQSLSTSQLLAIILRTGTTRDNVIELASKLLVKYGGLSGLMRAELSELSHEYGLGLAKTAQLKAALELGRRLGMLQPDEKYKISSPLDAANLVMAEMTFLDHEQMRILVLDSKNQVVENANRYTGTVNSSVLRVSEVFRPAITRNCPGVIICHNHPSGDPTPSKEDLIVTEQLVEAGKLLDIELVDHIIIGDHRFVSVKERLHW